MSKLFPAFLIGLLIASVSHGKDAYPPTGVEMRLQQVSDHVYYVQGQAGAATDNEGFISNAAAVVTDEGVVIFDVLERLHWPPGFSVSCAKSPTLRFAR